MSRVNASPLYIKVKHSLLEKIRKKYWLVDEQIPSEQELMEQYQVGRETIRKAVEILVREGYLYKKRGIGTFVKRNTAAWTLEPLISLSNLLASRGFSEKSIILHKELIKVDESINQFTKIPIGEKVIYIKRQRMIDNNPLAIEDAYFIFKEENSDYDFKNSITKYLLEYENVKLTKIDQTFIKRKPSEKECKLFNMDTSTADVIEMERWTYIEDYDDVYFYVKLVVLSDIYNYSF